MLAQHLSAPSRWGCTHARNPAAESKQSQHVCRARRRGGGGLQGGGDDGWKRELSKLTGVNYNPPQRNIVFDDSKVISTGTYDSSGRRVDDDDDDDGSDGDLTDAQLKALLEPGSDSDSESDDDDWSDNFDDLKGVVKDEEIFNLNSGWSISDYTDDGKQSQAKAKPKAKARKRASADEDEYNEEAVDNRRGERMPRLGMAARSILKSVPDNVLKALEQQQVEADAFNKQAKAKVSRRKNDKAKVGSMRIITGSAAGKRLTSPPGEGTRPMMEKVRGAVFSMVASLAGSQPLLPPGTRWLDLFAGTGAVGLEALSRGCEQCTFIEMDPAVARDSLTRNITTCGLTEKAAVLTLKAEDYLKNARNGSRFPGGKAFDFISVCPPYEAVSYDELFELLDGSPLVHDDSLVVVEYPKLLKNKMRETLGPLHRVRDKRYGRTFVAVYGPED